MNGTVLIIDDEALFREDLAALLSNRGLKCVTTDNAARGLECAREHAPDVILCDIVLPDRGGVEIVEELIGNSGDGAVVLMTAYGSIETAVQAFRSGATDYVLKPLVIEDVLQKIARILSSRSQRRELERLRAEERRTSSRMVVSSPAMTEVMELVDKVAQTRSSVLITGETGTGKELVARAVHERGTRAEGPFVPVNCAAIPESLLESELFGHVRGAFTGAERAKIGYFELADRGTLFLDEITELEPNLQSKLLRAIEERSVRRVGSTVARSVDVQIIAATNRDVQTEVAEGRCRQDLYYRLAVVEVAIPPLRKRRDDIQPLVESFLDRYSIEMKKQRPNLGPRALQALMTYSWPGNVRELENAVERAMILGSDEVLDIDRLPRAVADSVAWTRTETATGEGRPPAGGDAGGSGDCLRDVVRAFERAHIGRVLAEASGNREEAARRLGISASTLYRKMADLDLTSP